MRFGVLVSGRGSNLSALLDARAQGRLPEAVFRLVLSNVPGVRALEIAAAHGVATTPLDHRGFPGGRRAHDAAVRDALLAAGCEALVLAGYMRVIGPALLEAFPGRIVNIHPSLLPAFPGLEAPRQALEAGVRVSGCTVHFVDAGVDSGPIIVQRAVPVLDEDTPESLAARILEQEHAALVEAVDLLSRGRLVLEGRRVRRLESVRTG
ncbi:MAG: phosphoribosylglycinamide formyltransferase [Candidatus Sumerlaeia bacterium]|nr:phosphoribosylglycinamide formyltransferase [Candidatus Sumerlaeia bacterium]